jgi:hypothetical protein
LKILQFLTQNITFRILFIQFFIILTLLFSVLIIALIPPATGYELSIYEAYPTSLWVLLLINIFFSVYSIIGFCDSQSKISYYGYFSILLIETIILLLPIIRGYYSMSRGAGDIYYHMFVASQIVNSGYLPLTDIYPMMHIWLSFLHNFLPDLSILTIVLSIVFFIFYVLSLYILGKTIIGTKKGGIIVSTFGIPLIFSYGHYAYYPFLFALFIIPLILYSYQKITQNHHQKNFFYICLIFLSFFIVFCHPIITVFLIIMFSIFAFYDLFKRWKTKSWLSNIVALNVMTIVSVTFFTWISLFRSFLNTFQDIVSALLDQETHTSIVEYQVNMITTSNASPVLVIDHFIKIYGPVCLYFLISLLFILYQIYQYYRNRKVDENHLIYSLQFCASIFIGIALMTGYFVIFEPIRAAMYGLIFATILCGFFFNLIWVSITSEKRKLGIIISISLIISTVCLLTILAIYSSPLISLPNKGLTFEDKNGIDWILEYRNTEFPIVKEEDSMQPYSYYYYESMTNRIDQNLIEYPRIIPSNFGYNTNRTISESFAYLPDKNIYIVTTQLMKLAPYAVPVDRRSRLKSFTDSDFIRLKEDPSINLIYSSNKFAVWNIGTR